VLAIPQELCREEMHVCIYIPVYAMHIDIPVCGTTVVCGCIPSHLDVCFVCMDVCICICIYIPVYTMHLGIPVCGTTIWFHPFTCFWLDICMYVRLTLSPWLCASSPAGAWQGGDACMYLHTRICHAHRYTCV